MSLHKRGFGFGFGFGGRGADGKKGLPLALKRDGACRCICCVHSNVGWKCFGVAVERRRGLKKEKKKRRIPAPRWNPPSGNIIIFLVAFQLLL